MGKHRRKVCSNPSAAMPHAFPERHQRLVRTLYADDPPEPSERRPLPLQAARPSEGDPTLAPVRGNGRTYLTLRERLSLPGAVMLTNDEQYCSIVRSFGGAVHPLEHRLAAGGAPHLVVGASDADTPSALLRALVQSSGTLTVVFDADHPPPLLCRVRDLLVGYVASGSPFVNWERHHHGSSQAMSDKAFLRRVRPKTITELAKQLSRAAAQRGALSVSGVLAVAAELLGWTATVAAFPAACRARILPALDDPWPQVAGQAVELAVRRQGGNVNATQSVETFLTAVACSDLELARAFTSDRYHRKTQRRKEEWLALFVQWGVRSNEAAMALADALDDKPPPHTVLPTGVLEASRDAVRDALRRLACDAATELDWWVLGAAAHATHQGNDTRPLETLLSRGQPPCSGSVFEQAAARVREQFSGVTTVASQVELSEQGFHGAADCVLDGKAILELKFSRKPADGPQWCAWVLQAAVYARALRIGKARVFNVNDGAFCDVAVEKEGAASAKARS